MSHDAATIQKHVRIYIAVFVSLAFFTVATVTVSHLHLPTHYAIAVALLIATIKGSLVACYFMHLISEKKLILIVLLLTALFFFVLLLIPYWTVDEISRFHVS